MDTTKFQKRSEKGVASRNASTDRPLVAVILDAARPYDRLIIGGVAQYAREHGPWSMYVEEESLQKLPDLRHGHGQGIIANFNDPDSGIPSISTDNAVIGRLGAEQPV